MEAPQALTLLQYNRLIAESLRNRALNGVWVVAELSDVSVRNHCYLELIEKDAATGITVAKMRGIVWASTYFQISHRFETETGQKFTSGIKVMVKVNVNFHEQYGISVVISDINPSFTIGDMARKRMEILNRLEKEGIINDNKNLEMPTAPQRIAIISSADAAGYGDFMNQINHNTAGIVFYTVLFRAMMQGTDTAASIIAALDRIAECANLFDCVLITRGGGSTSDLNWFDDYDLAACVAQFPLPIITAIGHERDNTVLDYISNLRVKTPTAAAEWFIGEAEGVLNLVTNMAARISDSARSMISESRERLTRIGFQIPALAQELISSHNLRLHRIASQIPVASQSRISEQSVRLGNMAQQLTSAAHQIVKIESMKLTHFSDTVKAYSPENTLRRGYSITRTEDGKVVQSADNVAKGTTIVTTLQNGNLISKTI